MAKIWIQNHGVYELSDQSVNDLKHWLTSNNATCVEGADPGPIMNTDNTLLNEDQRFNEAQRGQQLGGPNQEPNQEPNQGPRKGPPSSDGTYDFGTTWI